MKKLFIPSILFVSLSFNLQAQQDFSKDMTTAKTAYNAGKLEESHFALMQAMQEIDLIVGQEILKLLPPKMDTMALVPKQDNVSTAVGFVGTTIHRLYGTGVRRADLSIVSNSPLIGMLNGLLNAPMIGMMSDGKTKTVRVQGYKGRLEKSEGSDGKTNYELQIPLSNTLITFKVDDCTDSQILALAETLPLPQIAKLLQ
jgi:hypothetical protein